MLTEKNPTVAFFLALFFGPFGMLYVSFSLALLYFLVNAGLMVVMFMSVLGAMHTKSLAPMVVPLLVLGAWLGASFHARQSAINHNDNLRKILNRNA